jgi:hypothetical protein
MRRSTARIQACKWLLIGLGLASVAQAARGQAVLRGRVVSDRDRSPLAGAELLLPALERAVRTPADGSFHLAELPAGTMHLLVRSIGFKPRSYEYTLQPGDTLLVELPLEPSAFELPPVTVTGYPEAWSRLGDRERRQRTAIGEFVSADELRGNEFLPLSQIIRRKSFVSMRPTRGGTAAFSFRDGAPCALALFLDDVYLGPIDPATRAPWNLDGFPVRGLEFVEVYRGMARVPVQYSTHGTHCGVIVLWSRRST